MNQFSIMTSAAEYVTSYNTGCITTGASVRAAKRWTEKEAREVLRIIKAKIDSGAEMFQNRAEEK